MLSVVFFPQTIRKIHALPMPIYGSINPLRQEMQSLLSREEIQIVNTFEKSRIERDNLLENNIKKGLRLSESYDFDEAGRYFDKVIAAIPSVDGLTQQERKLLAQAHTYKAKTLRIGSEADENIALTHLRLALTILPDFEEAISARDSILIERTLPAADSSPGSKHGR
ncbi:MAG: hypothetical protein K0S63_803 [Gammaproteobacteria bacterium]|nr:hypothetical protein [Gammaproteobacteria bacterium]